MALTKGRANQKLAGSLFGLLVGACLLPTSALAADATTTPMPTVLIDSRQALPLFPANSWKDGFFVEHSPISDFGLHIRATGVYGRDPLGQPMDGQPTIENRFTLHTAALVSLARWAEVGVAMPFVLYQDTTGLNLTKTALGDLRILGKINFHLPEKAPQIALSVGIGFQTASDGSSFGAGTISGYPRLIIDMPRLLDKRLHIAANLGAVLAGTKRPCTDEEIKEKQVAEMNMAAATNMMPGTGMTMTPDMGPNCEERQLGLGNHIMWGVGVNGLISVDQGFYITTELIGSFSVGTEQQTKTPLFWTIGVRRAKANATYFSAAYGLGLTDVSPSHTVLVALGLVWETTPPPKKKEPPTVKVDINLSGVPTGAKVSVGGKDGAKSETVVGGPKGEGKGEGGKGEGAKGEGKGDKGPPGAKPAGGGGPPKPAKPESVKTSTEVDLPEGLVPEEAKKDDKGKGEGKGKGKE